MFEILIGLILSPIAIIGGIFSFALICATGASVLQLFKKKRK